MKNSEIDIEAVKSAFDSVKLIKGQVISFGTSDQQGSPNIAPVGSMRIVDNKTVHVLQGELGRTVKNLKNNPKAVFSVTSQPKLRDLLNDKDGNLGYRVYCNFIGTEDSEGAIREESELLLNRIPFYLRRGFLKFIEANIKCLLKFEITDIRKVY